MNGNRATVQTAFNTPYPGPNGIGGVTVDGNSSDMKMNVDKKGNVNCSFSVQGIGISAQVFINMSSGNNTASVTISPNFNNNNLTLNGNIVPLDQSNIFKDVPGNRDTRILEQLRYKSRKMRTFVAEFFLIH